LGINGLEAFSDPIAKDGESQNEAQTFQCEFMGCFWTEQEEDRLEKVIHLKLQCG
jgi:hypothetical protein